MGPKLSGIYISRTNATPAIEALVVILTFGSVAEWVSIGGQVLQEDPCFSTLFYTLLYIFSQSPVPYAGLGSGASSYYFSNHKISLATKNQEKGFK